MVAAHRKSIWKKRRLSDIISSEGICRREGRSRGRLGPLTQGWHGQGWAAPPVRDSPSSLFSLLSSGSVGLLVKYDFW
jgi:hypothetical protein